MFLNRMALGVAVLCLISPAILWAQVGESSDKPFSVGLQVVPRDSNDEAIAIRVRQLFVQVLEENRGFQAHGYFKPKDVEAARKLDELVFEGTRKVSPALFGKVYLAGKKLLNEAFILGRRILAETSAESIASLYRGMGMVQAMEGNESLALRYWMTFLNLAPDQTRSSRSYNAKYLELFDRAKECYQSAGKFQVNMSVTPRDAQVRLDGEIVQPEDGPFELWGGGHLIQVEAEGYYRGGWIKDPDLHGTRWNLSLNPIESRKRQQEYVRRLKKTYRNGAPEPTGTVARWLYDLRDILGSKALLFVVVDAGETTVSLKGAFASSYDVFAVQETLQRDATILDCVRRVILGVSDVDAQKELARRRLHKEKVDRLAKWATSLTREIRDTEESLRSRAPLWQMAGEPDRKTLFLDTANQVGEIRERLKGIENRVRQTPDKANDELTDVTRTWKPLRLKAESLLAWDVEKALRDKEVSEVSRIYEESLKRVEDLNKRFREIRKNLSRTEQRNIKLNLRSLAKDIRTLRRASGKNLGLARHRDVLYRVAWKTIVLEEQLTNLQAP